MLKTNGAINKRIIEHLKKLLKIYNFSLDEKIMKNKKMLKNITALGIGDILITFNLLKFKFIKGPIIFNLYHYLVEPSWYPEPINAMDFRIKFIKKILTDNNFSEKDIVFVVYNSKYLNCHNNELKNFLSKEYWSLNLSIDKTLPSNILPGKYIVFHTKFRMFAGYEYNKVKEIMKTFYQNLKFNMPLVLLGEQEMVDSIEAVHHGITTIYNELLQLKIHNIVIDLTKKIIYNTLDINEYIYDINIIKNAYKNILIGCGGQFCSCLTFNGNNTITFIDKDCDAIKHINNFLINDVVFNDINK